MIDYNSNLVSTPSGAISLYENFLHGLKLSSENPFLGSRIIKNNKPGPFVFETYRQIHQRICNLGSAFMHLGLAPNSNVGLFSINRPEWVIGEQACYMFSLVTVPLYDTLGDDAIEYIINQTEMTTILVSKEKVHALLKILPRLPLLKCIILMDPLDDELIKLSSNDVTIISMKDLETVGEQNLHDPIPPTSNDIATICYTSGTTGLPKGVVLTHLNIISFVGSSFELMKLNKIYKFSKHDSYLSYLPLAHVFERCVMATLIYAGGKIGFYQGDTLKLMDDLAELKPTVFASVPRLYNRIFDKVMSGVNSAGFIGKKLFKHAYESKKANLKRGKISHFIWDKIIFKKIRSKLGGRVKFMMSGAAPISSDVIDFLRICFSATVQEGYGQTETAAGMTLTTSDDMTSGHVGIPFPSCKVKLVDLHEMGYTTNDKPFPRGEICCKGNNVFKEYYKLPEKTSETIDADGWCHSGDVGQWDAQGRLQVIDRVKNMFKLAQGEYVAAEKIEIILQKHELVSQAFVYGDSLQSTLVAIIVPDPDSIQNWASANGYTGKQTADLCGSPDFSKAVVKALGEHGKANGLKGFECIKNVHLDMRPFSVENGLLTPTFKLKRHEAKNLYKKKLDEMYAKL